MITFKSISDKFVVLRLYLPSIKNSGAVLVEMFLQITAAIIAFIMVKAVFSLMLWGSNYPTLIIPTTEISKLLSTEVSLVTLLNATVEFFMFLFVLLEFLRALIRLFRNSRTFNIPASK